MSERERALREWDPVRRLGEPGAAERARLGRALRREAERRLRAGESAPRDAARGRRWALAAGVAGALVLALLLARAGWPPRQEAPPALAESAAPPAISPPPGRAADPHAVSADASVARAEAPVRVAEAPAEVTPRAAEAVGTAPPAPSPLATAPVRLEMTATNGVRIYWKIQASPGT